MFVRTALVLFASVALALAEPSAVYNLRFRQNPALPRDTVMLSPDVVASSAWFYKARPAERPAGVPAWYVAVFVVQFRAGEPARLFGWQWMDAETVNALHRNPDDVL